jgi:peroxiredoxin
VLTVGQPAPPFSAMTTQGSTLSLEALRGRIVVLYFFRKAFTPNCTVETKGFRDNYQDLRALGAEVIGVSSDDLPTQCRFVEHHEVSFPMIADEDRALAKLYGVLFMFLPISHRVTYVIDPVGTIAGVFHHEFAVIKHLDEVVSFVRRLAGAPSLPPKSHP